MTEKMLVSNELQNIHSTCLLRYTCLLFLGKKSILHIYSGIHIYSEGESNNCLISISDTADTEGRSALSWSALSGKVHTTNCLLDHGANISHADKKGCAPLDLASAKGHSEVVQLLLEKGANLEHVDIGKRNF